MKARFYIILFVSFILAFQSYGQAPAFPSAEGYGRFATGGRGDGTNGYVVEVTNLEDDVDNPPQGSFRWALKQGIKIIHNPIIGDIKVKLPLTVVFRVGGVIRLKGELRIDRSNITIAGQTAPGDGICFSGATISFSADNENIIVRYIRSRPGDQHELGDEVSAFRIENGENFIIDHCSFSWSVEETTHFSSSPDFTVQWCIISEAFYNSYHKKGPRGYAAQWGGQYATYHHNLLAHNQSRMPRINGSNENDLYALVDYRNNVNYNWGSSGAFYGGEWEATGGIGFCHTNVVNNYFVPGPGTSGAKFARPSLNRDGRELDGYGLWYFDGNVMKDYDNLTNDNWLGVDGSNVGGTENIRSDVEFVKTDGELEQYERYTQTADMAYLDVIDNVGATLPKRDAHDTRLIGELTGEIPVVRYAYTDTSGQTSPYLGIESGMIDTQENLVSPEDRAAGKDAWSVYTASAPEDAPVDSDHDGMPDAWEIENGLDPSDSLDFRLITESGYTNLEIYLNELAGETVTTVSEIASTSPRLKVYPNPVSDRLYFESKSEISSIELYNITGEMILSKPVENGSNMINLSGITTGIYMVKAITINHQEFFQKIIKN